MNTTMPRSPRSARIRLSLLLVATAAAIVALHRLGGADWATIDWSRQWLDTTPVDRSIAALVRVGALGAAWWLLVGTVALWVVENRGHGRARSRLRGLVPCSVRTLVQRSVVSVAAASTLLTTPALAAVDSPSGSTVVRAAPAGTVVATPQGSLLPPGVVPPQVRAHPVSPDPTTNAFPDEGGSLADEAVHVVAPGDHLWSIAATHLADRLGRPAATLDDRVVARYWRAVLAANDDRLRSGNPNLIHPGETIILPSIGPSAGADPNGQHEHVEGP